MDINIIARVRKLVEALASAPEDSEEQLSLSEQLELLVAAGAPAYQELTKAGRSFVTNTTTAIAAIVAVPSTAHLVALYNNEPDGGRSYVINWVAALNAASAATAAQATLLGLLGTVREAAPTDAAVTIRSMNGIGGRDTKARVILNATALPATTGIAANWFPLGPSGTKPGAATTPGYGVFAVVDGRIIVPPGRYFAIHVLANVVTETFNGFIGWHEAQLRLG